MMNDFPSSEDDRQLLYTRMHESADFLRSKGVGAIDVGIILGSGLSDVGREIDDAISIPYPEIPYMPASGAPGHEGVLRYSRMGAHRVLVFSGRLHFYEGYPMWQVAYPVRILQALGVPRLLTTAAVGGLSDKVKQGDLMLLTDHLNLMPDNPLRGFPDPRLGDRFPDLSGVYDQKWGAKIMEKANTQGIPLKTGIYAGLAGPSFETQAECAMLRQMGADVVGMSIIPEVIVAAQAGIRVSACCVVANMAWHPETPVGMTAEEVLMSVREVTGKFSALIRTCCL